MKFGRLVQRQLGGPAIATTDGLTENIGMRMALLPPKRDSLHLSARLSGRIRFLGPTYNEIIADLKKTAAWKANINRHTQAQYLPAAMEESDMFLEVLEQKRRLLCRTSRCFEATLTGTKAIWR